VNEEQRKLREIVERATAADDFPPDELDAEAASLRKGWLQLGRLIEEDVRSGGKHPGSRHVASGNPSRVKVAPPASRSRQPKWSFWLVAFAASLLVAAGVAFGLRFMNGVHGPQQDSLQVTRGNDPAKQPTEHATTPKPESASKVGPETQVANSGDAMQWGDSVDDDITAVGQATIYAQQDAYAQSSGAWGIQAGLNELKQEMELGNL